ncbi:hypothetical protein AAZX31_11G182200 [Glycine max]|uniref:Photosystem I reaction center subunit VI n=1 Tax=Glycine max TaxID=3847 RepID=K7LQM9_SOYBN|nr:photosystem I reaction center subunit VI, chloroplastic [Glycine max]KAG4974550.1 hypothetical protein JHK87_031371 [Glycine soja]KAG4989124.1 hypothetical protein JHK85_032107 [Glycine max]KAG4994715.1 hypothetical protein JHK86_031542 [Glycine max]KAG5124712.1 hypothetical protein JHK82_031449 [Glycine max]KAG5146133.1 hypothetical protein JHK84_031676 [Glycine max]|eukprot:XP_003539252.1 photosystem I reaction center subunit VI, chloroplastic [Glycine max]
MASLASLDIVQPSTIKGLAGSSLTGTKLSFKPSHQSFRPKNFRNGVVVANYGDKSVYFDLEDLGNTIGQWDLYVFDAPSPYNPLRVRFSSVNLFIVYSFN